MSWQVAGYQTDADKPFDQGSFGTLWHARRVHDGRPGPVTGRLGQLVWEEVARQTGWRA